MTATTTGCYWRDTFETNGEPCGARPVMLDRDGEPLCRDHRPRCDARTSMAAGWRGCSRRATVWGMTRITLDRGGPGEDRIELCEQHRRIADRHGVIIDMFARMHWTPRQWRKPLAAPAAA